jgi:hypothetical protein
LIFDGSRTWLSIHDPTLSNPDKSADVTEGINADVDPDTTPTLPTAAPSELPTKPQNKIEEQRSRDFYPITWRVIGGGVMMAGSSMSHPVYLCYLAVFF